MPPGGRGVLCVCYSCGNQSGLFLRGVHLDGRENFVRIRDGEVVVVVCRRQNRSEVRAIFLFPLPSHSRKSIKMI